MFSDDVSASRRAIKVRHPIVHQYDIGAVPVVSMNRLQTGADHLNHLVAEMLNKLRQGGAHAFLVVRD